MALTFDSVDSVLAAVGSDLGATAWMLLEQPRIDQFAAAVGDARWQHIDPQRAAAGPHGGCTAHDFLTLALANKFLPELAHWQRLRMGLNIGCDRLRFPAPARAGARVRGRGEVIAAARSKGDGVQVTIRITVEVEGADQPACVVDTISRLFFY